MSGLQQALRRWRFVSHDGWPLQELDLSKPVNQLHLLRSLPMHLLDRKQRPGYMYQALPTITEDTGKPVQSATYSENVGGSRDLAISQMSELIDPPLVPLVGCKHSVSSAISCSVDYGITPRKLALAADFSPSHFQEPVSDNCIPPQQPPLLHQHHLLPM